jgi:hypothetical protein
MGLVFFRHMPLVFGAAALVSGCALLHPRSLDKRLPAADAVLAGLTGAAAVGVAGAYVDDNHGYYGSREVPMGVSSAAGTLALAAMLFTISALSGFARDRPIEPRGSPCHENADCWKGRHCVWRSVSTPRYPAPRSGTCQLE